MSDITLITPPDKVYTQEYSFLLIYPSKIIKEQFQTFLANTEVPFHVYIYEMEDDHEAEWLLDVFHIADTVIVDIDNCESSIRSLAAYFIARDKTYWLTNGTTNHYNVISKNRIFDLDFLEKKIGGQFGKSR